MPPSTSATSSSRRFLALRARTRITTPCITSTRFISSPTPSPSRSISTTSPIASPHAELAEETYSQADDQYDPAWHHDVDLSAQHHPEAEPEVQHEKKLTQKEFDDAFLWKLTHPAPKLAKGEAHSAESVAAAASKIGIELPELEAALKLPQSKSRKTRSIAAKAAVARHRDNEARGVKEETDPKVVWRSITDDYYYVPAGSTPRSSPIESKIPVIPYDPSGMLSSISSFRRPSNWNAAEGPTLTTLFALKPASRPPHHQSRNYKKEYNALWDKVWITFKVSEIFDIYAEMMSMPDPADIRSRINRAATGSTSANENTTLRLASGGSPRKGPAPGEPWPSIGPHGGAKTGIWVHDHEHPFSGMITWKRAVKRVVVDEILSVWGWKPLELVEAEEKRKAMLQKVQKRDYRMTDAEAFLIVRKGGKAMQQKWKDALFSILESEERIKLEEGTTKETLQGQVFRARAKGMEHLQIEKYLEARKKDIAYEPIKDYDLTLERLYPTVSRLTGAFLCPATPDSPASIAFLDPSSRDKTLNLLSTLQNAMVSTPSSASVISLTSSAATLSLDGSSAPEKFGLYPYVQVGGAGSGLESEEWKLQGLSLFRMRRTGGWFAHRSAATSQEDYDCETTVFRGVEIAKEVPQAEKGVTRETLVTPGQLFFTRDTPTSKSMIPPLAGARSLEQLKSWAVEKRSVPVFLPAEAPAAAGTEGADAFRRVRYARAGELEAGKAREFVEIRKVGEDKPKAFQVTERVSHVLRPDQSNDLQIVERTTRFMATVPKAFTAAVNTTPYKLIVKDVEYTLVCDESVTVTDGEEAVVDLIGGMGRKVGKRSEGALVLDAAGLSKL